MSVRVSLYCPESTDIHQGQTAESSALRPSAGFCDPGVKTGIGSALRGCFSILTMGKSGLGRRARTSGGRRSDCSGIGGDSGPGSARPDLTARRNEYPVTGIQGSSYKGSRRRLPPSFESPGVHSSPLEFPPVLEIFWRRGRQKRYRHAPVPERPAAWALNSTHARQEANEAGTRS